MSLVGYSKALICRVGVIFGLVFESSRAEAEPPAPSWAPSRQARRGPGRPERARRSSSHAILTSTETLFTCSQAPSGVPAGPLVLADACRANCGYFGAVAPPRPVHPLNPRAMFFPGLARPIRLRALSAGGRGRERARPEPWLFTSHRTIVRTHEPIRTSNIPAFHTHCIFIQTLIF